jgi:hypothetical protein
MIKLQDLLYCTVTREKAAIHIVASKIRKSPHRGTFSASSSCCMNLSDRGIMKVLEDICDGLRQRFKSINILHICRSCQKILSAGLNLFDRKVTKYMFAITSNVNTLLAVY